MSDTIMDVFAELERELSIIDGAGEIPPAGVGYVRIDAMQYGLKAVERKLSYDVQYDALIEAVKKASDAAIAQIGAKKKHAADGFLNVENWIKSNMPVDIKTGKPARQMFLTYKTAKLRKCPESLKVGNEEECLKWAQDHCPAAWRIKEVQSIDKKALKEHWKTTGEIPPGCAVEEEHDNLSFE
jgi:hypothetical protein